MDDRIKVIKASNAKTLQQAYKHIRMQSNLKNTHKNKLFLDRFLKVTFSMTHSACQRDCSEASFRIFKFGISVPNFTFHPLTWHSLFFLRTYGLTKAGINGQTTRYGSQHLTVSVPLQCSPMITRLQWPTSDLIIFLPPLSSHLTLALRKSTLNL